MERKRYQVQAAGSLVYVIDGGKPYIVQITENHNNDPVTTTTRVIDVVVSSGADLDPGFTKKIYAAKSITECKEISKAW